MVLGEATPWLAGLALILTPLAAIAGYWLSRRSEREANATQREAVKAKAKLDEVEALRVVVESVTEEAERLRVLLDDTNTELEKARSKVDDVNRELRAAQRNVRVLRVALETNGVSIPHLEPMHDVH